MNLLRPPPSADVYTWTGASFYRMCLMNESPSAQPWANTLSWMGSSATKHNINGRHDGFTVTDRVMWSVAEYFEDLRHLPSGSQVHSEAWHGAACGQADYAAQRRSKIVSLCLYRRRQSTAFSSQSQVVCLLFEHVLLEGRGRKKKEYTELENQPNRWWKSEDEQSEEGQTGRKLNRSYKCSL